MKQVKIENDVHEKLAAYCTKDKTFSECVDGLLAGEPFIERLREVLPKTIEKIKENKKSALRADLFAADQLVYEAQSIIKICDERSGKVLPQHAKEALRPVTKKLRDYTNALKKGEIDDQEKAEKLKQIVDEFDRVLEEIE